MTGVRRIVSVRVETVIEADTEEAVQATAAALVRLAADAIERHPGASVDFASHVTRRP